MIRYRLRIADSFGSIVETAILTAPTVPVEDVLRIAISLGKGAFNSIGSGATLEVVDDSDTTLFKYGTGLTLPEQV